LEIIPNSYCRLKTKQAKTLLAEVKEKNMACKCSKSEIEFLVIGALCAALDRADVVPGSRFGKEIDIDPFAKRRLFVPVKRAVDHDDCVLERLSEGDFENFKKVKDIIDAVVKEFECS
jgi:hypothetical protein